MLHQRLTPGDAGILYRRERQRRQITVAQAATDTRIRSSIITAIEEGNVRELPTSVFARGLIRTYARYLGIDPRPYLAAYLARVPDELVAVASGRQRRRSARTSVMAGALLPVALVAAIVLLGGYLYQQYVAFVSEPSIAAARPPGGSILISTPLPSPPAAASIPTATAVRSPQLPVPTIGAAAPPATAVPTPTIVVLATATVIPGVHIDAVAVARVWIQVEVDGKVSFAGILNPGDRKSWTASQKIMVWSGNASSLNVTFNGKPVGSLGAPGEVVKVTWTATS